MNFIFFYCIPIKTKANLKKRLGVIAYAIRHFSATYSEKDPALFFFYHPDHNSGNW
jgi:hypothetical protein